jgi:large subunit ribosomal protein L6
MQKQILNYPNKLNVVLRNNKNVQSLYLLNPIKKDKCHKITVTNNIFLSLKEKGELIVELPKFTSITKSQFKLYVTLLRILINQSVYTEKQILKLEGVGYKFILNTKYNYLFISAGFSKPAYFKLPYEIRFQISNEKSNELTLLHFSRQCLGEIISQLKCIKPVNIYLGKGIKKLNEVIKLKEGKKQK